MRYLVDANVLSEATKPRPDPRVVDWLARSERELAVDPIILGELRFGILLLPRGQRRVRLERGSTKAQRAYSVSPGTRTLWRPPKRWLGCAPCPEITIRSAPPSAAHFADIERRIQRSKGARCHVGPTTAVRPGFSPNRTAMNPRGLKSDRVSKLKATTGVTTSLRAGHSFLPQTCQRPR